jgi:integrase
VKLTMKRVSKLVHGGVPGRHCDDASIGLYLIIGGPKAAHWELRYQLDHRCRWMGLGSAKTFNLLEARERARRERQRIADGTDPLESRRAERAAKAAADVKRMTFKEAAAAYIEAHQGKWRSAVHGKQWTNTLATYVYPLIGNLDIADIDVPAVLKVLEQPVAGTGRYPAGKLWTERAVTADRVRNRVELILSWATAREYRHGDNPADWDTLKHILPGSKAAKVIPHRAIPFAEIPALMDELQRHEDVGARALLFLILTAARANEVLGAVHDEVDFPNRVWTVPASRMKGGKEHRVPLSDAAMDVLQSLPTETGNPYLFIGARKQALSHAAMTHLLHRLNCSGTIHGFRAAFSTWAREKTRHDHDACEMCLAHTVGGSTERSYRRGDLWDKRRAIMDDWARFCTEPVATGDNVVAMGGR